MSADPTTTLRDLPDLPAALTVDEAAGLLRISRSQVYRAARSGALPSLRVGRTVRIPTHRLLEILGVESAS